MSSQSDYPKWIMEKLRWLEYDHLPEGLERDVARRICLMAYEMVDDLLVNEDALPVAVDQLLIGLQRLIDAKDPLVRVAVAIRQSGRFMTPAPPAAKRKLFVVMSHAGLELATFDVMEAANKVAELAKLLAYQKDGKLHIEETLV